MDTQPDSPNESVNSTNSHVLSSVLSSEGVDSFFVGKNDYPYLIDQSILSDLSARLLCQEIKSVLLTGPTGSGKTALIKHFANYIGDVSHPLLNQLKILCINVPSILAGSEYRGSFEKKVTLILNECQKYSNLVLFFDEAHGMRFTNFREGIGFMDVLKPHMISSNLRVILATTDREVKHLEHDQAFMRRVHKIKLNALSQEQIKLIAHQHYRRLLKKHKAVSPTIEDISESVLNNIFDRFATLHEIVDAIDFELSKRGLNEQIGKKSSVQV
jgi:ATP-dependent Clp protease ATP-binding subunit ClpA